MSCGHIQRFAAAIIYLVVCSNIFLQSMAQISNQDDCRRQCWSYSQYLASLHYTTTYLNNYINTCYRRCPQGGSFYQPTPTPTIRTTTSSYYKAQGCGVPFAGRQRVLGGGDAEECEFPWMVGVTINTLFCGGTILDRRHILTAAHCLKNKYTGVIAPASQVLVRAGSSQLIKLKVYKVQQVFVDYRHVPVINDYDVAVLRLSEDLTFSSCVNPICLPQVWEDPRKAEKCVAAGWGIDNFYSQSLTQNLKKVTLPIVDNSLCVQSYGSNYVNNLKLCAGNFYNGGIDTCQGDSGGPLMCKFGNRFVVTGIVSFGSGCAQPRFPGVYTRVAHESILNFIRQASRSY